MSGISTSHPPIQSNIAALGEQELTIPAKATKEAITTATEIAKKIVEKPGSSGRWLAAATAAGLAVTVTTIVKGIMAKPGSSEQLLGGAAAAGLGVTIVLILLITSPLGERLPELTKEQLEKLELTPEQMNRLMESNLLIELTKETKLTPEI